MSEIIIPKPTPVPSPAVEDIAVATEIVQMGMSQLDDICVKADRLRALVRVMLAPTPELSWMTVTKDNEGLLTTYLEARQELVDIVNALPENAGSLPTPVVEDVVPP